jgi:hypothetical protein
MIGVMFIFWTIAAFCFVSAFFPQWNLRWGGPGGRPFHEKAPVSVQGRVGFGVVFAYFGLAELIGEYFGDYRQLLGPLLMTVGALLLAGLFVIALRDRRRYRGAESR